MKLDLDIAKKLNLKATQVQDCELKIMSEKAKRKSAFERNLNPDSYFWTHRFRVTKRHSRKT